LTIGRPQGVVWIGKPMDVVIPVSLDSAEGEGSLCLGADVVQGDAPMLDRRVTVSLESGGSSGSSNIHVRSTVPVEEPVVTLTVRAGCNMTSTRTYTLLADVPSDVTPPAAAPGAARSADMAAAPRPAMRAASRSTGEAGGAFGGAPVASNRRANSPVDPAPERASEPPAPRRAAAAPSPAAPRRAPVPVQAPVRVAAAPVAQPKTEPSSAGPRLQVEALEPEPAQVAGLKSTTGLTLPAAEDPARRAAAAALWGALNPVAEESKRDDQRMKDLDATLAALRAQTAQNQRALTDLRSELAQAREDRYRNPLVYALAAMLLLALFGMLLLWRQARRAAAPAWWSDSTQRAGKDPRRPRRDGGLLDDDMDLDTDAGEPSPRKRSIGAPTFGPFAPGREDSGFGDAAVSPLRALDGSPARSVNTEELFDVQQQSDFFLSLGQQEQAIAVLREHIAANPGTSALAYLDLLRIFHSLDRKEDYARVAEEFERAFNADVPAFEKFADAGRGLEHYRSTLARIESQWPAPGTLALIEELIFRKPGVHEEGAYDLAAYQELLLLYSIAKEVIEPGAAQLPVTQNAFVDTYSHDDAAPTVTAPIEPEMPPPVIEGGPTLPASIYGSIDDKLHHDTVMAPDVPTISPPATGAPVHGARPAPELDLAEFDKTAYETMPTPIEPPKVSTPSNDPHVIDFELFDPATEAEIAPRPIIKR
jgi:hypothetical protein